MAIRPGGTGLGITCSDSRLSYWGGGAVVGAVDGRMLSAQEGDEPRSASEAFRSLLRVTVGLAKSFRDTVICPRLLEL